MTKATEAATRVVLKVALFRRGVEKFEQEVNALLAKGYSLDMVSVDKKGLRFVCVAVLKK